MTQDGTTSGNRDGGLPNPTPLASTYYGVLGLHPSASTQQIRHRYRELSKRYHPDTTDLPAIVATEKFQQLNEAYATLNNPLHRSIYDRKLFHSRFSTIPQTANLKQPFSWEGDIESFSSPPLEPSDRPLSSGEVFALFILSLTFLACLLLVIVVGLIRGDKVVQPLTWQTGEDMLLQSLTWPTGEDMLLQLHADASEQSLSGPRLRSQLNVIERSQREARFGTLIL